ncbi:MAG: hypothetical protein OXI81_00685 [Paracoccaceae bacterium]|nr:hypothetical protein [Paracoccaceae bacterium]
MSWKTNPRSTQPYGHDREVVALGVRAVSGRTDDGLVGENVEGELGR